MGFAGVLLARFSENSAFPDLPYVILDSAPCAPRPVVVEVPQSVEANTFYFPFFVRLHRCGGACNARPYDTICQPHGRSKELLKGVASGFVHFEKFSLNFSNSSFATHVSIFSILNHSCSSLVL